MMDYESISDQAWNRAGCGCVLISALVVALLVAVVATRAHGAAADQWLCQYTDSLTVYPHVRVAQFDGEGWPEMPDDLGQRSIPFLPMSEDFVSGYSLEFSPTAQELWLWPFWSLESRTDATGDHEGHHDFCPVLIYDLS